jgi:hypothetical protein
MERLSDERQYASWIIRHDPGGFILNRSGSNWIIHKTSCEHIQPGHGDDITKNPKLASTARHELARYAKDNDGQLLQCRTCGS